MFLEPINEVSDAIVGDEGCAVDLDGQVDDVPLLGLAADRASGELGGNAVECSHPPVLTVLIKRALAQRCKSLVTLGVVAVGSVQLFQNGPRRDLGGVEVDKLIKEG